MINSTVKTNAKQIAQHFNDLFTTIPEKNNSKIVKAKFTHFPFQV